MIGHSAVYNGVRYELTSSERVPGHSIVTIGGRVHFTGPAENAAIIYETLIAPYISYRERQDRSLQRAIGR